MQKYDINYIFSNEESFHDQLALNSTHLEDVAIWEKESWKYIFDTLGNLENKKVLDIGCGLGRESIFMAKNGALVTGIDISSKNIEKAKQYASEYKANNTRFIVINIYNLNYIDEFDIVFCRASLHHFPDVNSVIQKAHKSLKVGGIMIIQEPKAENPIAIIGRRFFNPTTITEHPFKFGELEAQFQKVFKNVNVKYFYIFSPICFIFNKIKYIKNKRLEDLFFSLLNPFDNFLLSFNLFKKFSWILVLMGRK
jgi:2-polyprenyl-3-methyl-5-hydroxy-6-metoxy-1,4-benzoquinol methylase